MAELERFVGEPLLAGRLENFATTLAERATAEFWDEQRGAIADTGERKTFSEHAQCLALLSGRIDAQKAKRIVEALETADFLTACSPFFGHYVLEALQQQGRMEAFFRRLGVWHRMKREGLRTTYEVDFTSRSDCHAWAAHPLFHAFASVVGIRPAAMGFSTVSITPQLGPLGFARARMVHSAGDIVVDLRKDGEGLAGTVELPGSLTGVFAHEGQEIALTPGRQSVRVPR